MQTPDDDAAILLRKKLGLPAEANFDTLDPVAATQRGAPGALPALTAIARVQTLLSVSETLGATHQKPQGSMLDATLSALIDNLDSSLESNPVMAGIFNEVCLFCENLLIL